jgi:hypothetical protein
MSVWNAYKHELSDIDTTRYLIVRLPKRHYVTKPGEAHFTGKPGYRIAEIPEGWERKANCQTYTPSDQIQPRLAARRQWARTYGHVTRFRKDED